MHSSENVAVRCGSYYLANVTSAETRLRARRLARAAITQLNSTTFRVHKNAAITNGVRL